MSQAEEALAAHVLLDPEVEGKIFEILTSHISEGTHISDVLVEALFKHPLVVRRIGEIVKRCAIEVHQDYGTGNFRFNLLPPEF